MHPAIELNENNLDFYTLSDKAIEEELGARIKSLRLRKNITQKSLAASARLSLNAIKSLEMGRSKISTLIAVLRELNSLDQLENFIPEAVISPLQLAKMQGKTRERASSEQPKKPKDESDW